MTEWTFVTNHAVVLSFVAKYPKITTKEMADEIGITERAVQRCPRARPPVIAAVAGPLRSAYGLPA